MDMSEALALESPDAQVISVKGSQYEVPEAARNAVALLSDWTLVVVESYKSDHGVRAYERLLSGFGVKFERRFVNLEQFANLQSGSLSKTADKADVSKMQIRAIGLIKQCVKEGASDLHILNYANRTVLKMRIHGLLFEKMELNPEEGQALCRCMYESMTDVAEPNYNDRETQDGRLSRDFLKAAGLNGARIATRPMEYGNLLVLRLLYGNMKKQKTLANLGYNARQIKAIQQMLRRRGINIFSGVTGSGKSTSLQVVLSMLLDLHHRLINLLTVEQPLEYVIDGAVQTPLIVANMDDLNSISEAWAKSISNLMRLDPDYIMVGELRDLASAIAGIHAALTGHPMWTTTHARDGFATFDRLADLGVPERRLADAALFTGVINQSLAPILCPACKRPFKLHSKELAPDLCERVERFCIPSAVFVRGNKPDCEVCGGIGVVDRTVVAEVVLTSQKLLNIYRSADGGSSAARTYWVKEMGGITKSQHLIHKINEGVVDPYLGEEAVCGLDEDLLTIG
ncbi:ATPase, T2SS/T4P/T4SS family [Burkholderia thailandensis]|uniref:GspE/PulE family protein n=1 Tax=Burkholderia thailandensis TaxID=57975 RepID=UPI00217EFADB|nr:ATPase, T2SS/T4P/T4SS family [Burkholderia thailandensis]MCS6496758.1 ATPase, T2SS/T4P/T4SS family [Burkholderia thailandensis]